MKKLLLFASISIATFTTGFSKVILSKSLSVSEFSIGNLISWETKSEQNTSKFIIQKKLNNGEFVGIVLINANGSDVKTTNYEFLDAALGEKESTYRLVEVESSGTLNYLQFTTFARKTENVYSLNFVNDISNLQNQMVIELNAAMDLTIQYQVIRGMDIILSTRNTKVTKGLNKLEIPLENMPAGMFTLKFTFNNEVESVVLNKVSDSRIEIVYQN